MKCVLNGWKPWLRATVLVAVLGSIAGKMLITTADAEENSNSLIMKCRKVAHITEASSQLDKLDAIMCIWYLRGYVDGCSRLSDPMACVPTAVMGRQLAAVYIKWAY